MRLGDAGFAGQVMVLTSAGGMLEAADVAEAPIRVINSGPSMAPLAGQYYADLEGGWRNAVIADTGGTTYDISLVRDAEIPMTRDLWIGHAGRGHLVGYPSVDVKSVGAGGGSIAHVDTGGLLHVGPQSAGSVPGPVCYGRGGERPTVTDACLVLGYLDPDFFLGGAMRLDVEAARRAIARDVAAPLGLSVEEAAWNILSLTTENMVQAIQEITVNQGVDPADAVLIGGGGAAGLNSVFIARRLGCRTLVIPETGAALSAAGALMSDLTAEFAASVFTTTAAFDGERINATLDVLNDRCLAFADRVGAAEGDARIRLIAEARYENQVWDIDAPLEAGRFNGAASVDRFRARFDAAHERIFTIADPDSSVEIVGVRAQVRCRGGRERRLQAEGRAAARRPPAPVGPPISAAACAKRRSTAWMSLAAGRPPAGARADRIPVHHHRGGSRRPVPAVGRRQHRHRDLRLAPCPSNPAAAPPWPSSTAVWRAWSARCPTPCCAPGDRAC